MPFSHATAIIYHIALLLTWFVPRHVWISLNSTNTSNCSRTIKHSSDAPVRVFPHPRLVFNSSAHWQERGLFPCQPVHPQLSSLTTAVKTGRFGSEITKGKSNKKVTSGWKNDWSLRCRRSGWALLVLQRKAVALFCVSQQLWRERLTRQSTLNGRATKPPHKTGARCHVTHPFKLQDVLNELHMELY